MRGGMRRFMVCLIAMFLLIPGSTLAWGDGEAVREG